MLAKSIIKGSCPELLTDTFCAGLVLPTNWGSNDKLVIETCACGVVGIKPLPCVGSTVGSPAFEVTVTTPTYEITFVGENMIVKVQFAFIARVCWQ